MVNGASDRICIAGRFSSKRALPNIEHAQPSATSACAFLASRDRLASNFSCQKARRLFGTVERWQPWACQ